MKALGLGLLCRSVASSVQVAGAVRDGLESAKSADVSTLAEAIEFFDSVPPDAPTISLLSKRAENGVRYIATVSTRSALGAGLGMSSRP